MNDTDRQAKGAEIEKCDMEDRIQERWRRREGETETQEPKVRRKEKWQKEINRGIKVRGKASDGQEIMGIKMKGERGMD